MKLLLIFSLTLSLNFSCGNTKPVQHQENVQQENVQKPTSKEVTAEQQEPENKPVEKYGFQFQIPEHWKLDLSDFDTKDLKEEVKSKKTVYLDFTSLSSISLIYHPGRYGRLLYNYYSKDTSGKTKKIKIGELDAIQTDEFLTRDGKGHLLKRPRIRHKIYMMAPGEKGVLEVVYDLPKDNEKAGQVYKDFINSIKPVK